MLTNTNVNLCDNRIKWDNFTNNDIEKYCSCTDEYLGEIRLNANTFACTDLKCDNDSHKDNIDKLYKDIVKSMVLSGEKIASKQNNKYVHRPGWNDYVSDLYESSRETRSIWLAHGKPRQGPIFQLHTKTKMRGNYAIRFIKRNENQLRREALAKKLGNSNKDEFWKEIQYLNKCNTPLLDSHQQCNWCSKYLRALEKALF